MEYFLPVWRFAIRGADKHDLETLDLGFTGLGFEIADRCFSWRKALGGPFARPFRAAVYDLQRFGQRLSSSVGRTHPGTGAPIHTLYKCELNKNLLQRAHG
jgi:hypothetical protein